MSETAPPASLLALQNLILGKWVSQAVSVAAKLGIADLLKDAKLYKHIGGPAGQELATTWQPGAAFGPVNYDVGVIAGTRSIDPASSAIIPGPDDGKVSVKSTELQGMKERIILPVTHTFMPENRRVISQTRHFLMTGTFITP